MANIQESDVVAFIGNLSTYLTAIPEVVNVLDRRRSIANRAEYFELLGNGGVDKNELDFSEIEFLKFEDSDTEGDDDCPVAVMTFGIHLFREHVDQRSDGSNSSFDFLGAILAIRKKILEDSFRQCDAGDFVGTFDPVTMPDFAQFGNDGFVDAVGHIGNLNLLVRFYDKQSVPFEQGN